MTSSDPPLRARRSARRPGSVYVDASGVRVPLALRRVAAIAARVLSAERARAVHIEVSFVSARAIARLHRRTMGRAGATDIVTLQHRGAGRGAPAVGEVFIAPRVASDNARRFKRPVREEIARLTIHGVLHALGWDHPAGDERESSPMWQRQEALLRGCRRAGLA